MSYEIMIIAICFLALICVAAWFVFVCYLFISYCTGKNVNKVSLAAVIFVAVAVYTIIAMIEIVEFIVYLL